MNTARAPFILYVFGGPLDVGGAERQLLALAPGLVRNGFRVEILCLQGRGKLADEMEAGGVPVHAVPWASWEAPGLLARLGRTVRALRALRRQVRQLSPELVHFVLPRGYVIGGFATLWLHGPRRVMSRRGRNRYLTGRALARGLEAFLHRRMDALLGNARAVVHDLVEEGAPPARVGLIHNGIDPTRFDATADTKAVRDSLKVPADALLLVKVANLWPCKGHADLLDALARATFTRDWRLLLVGRDEGQARPLREQVRRLGLQDRVLFAGARDDVPALLAAADIGISASHEEGFSNAVLEYLAAGLATVVTDVGGNQEAVGAAGIVVAPGDVDGLAVALRALGDDQARAALASEARQRAVQFDMPGCIRRHRLLYRALLDGRGLPAELQMSG